MTELKVRWTVQRDDDGSLCRQLAMDLKVCLCLDYPSKEIVAFFGKKTNESNP